MATTPISAKASKGFAPVNQLPAAQKVLEGNRLALTGLRVSDIDAGDSTMSVTLSVTHGSLFLAPSSGVTLTYGSGGRVVITGMRVMATSSNGGISWKFIEEGDTTTDWYQAVRTEKNTGQVMAVGHAGRIIRING